MHLLKVQDTQSMADILYLPDLQVGGEDPLALEPVVGMVDDPAGQKQLPLALPLGSSGHVAVFGSPGSGKTVFLQTVAMSLCSTCSPDDVNLYAMDFGSWSLAAFKNFPHMCMVANGSDEWGYSWGYYVSIYHDSTYSTLYAHMSSVAVSAGQKVKKGDIIGYVGNTGYSFGNHLHFEVYKDGTRVNPGAYV